MYPPGGKEDRATDRLTSQENARLQCHDEKCNRIYDTDSAMGTLNLSGA